MSTDDVSVWEDARRLAEELEVQVYLASMDTRDRWHKLERRLGRLERTIARSSEHLGALVMHELREVRDALRALRDDVYRGTDALASEGRRAM